MIGPRALRFTALLALSALASCTAAKNTRTVTHTDGRVEQDENKVLALGGRGANSNRGTAWDNVKSFDSAMIAGTTVGLGVVGAMATKATEATKQVASKQAGSTARTGLTQKGLTDRASFGAGFAPPGYAPVPVPATAAPVP